LNESLGCAVEATFAYFVYFYTIEAFVG